MPGRASGSRGVFSFPSRPCRALLAVGCSHCVVGVEANSSREREEDQRIGDGVAVMMRPSPPPVQTKRGLACDLRSSTLIPAALRRRVEHGDLVLDGASWVCVVFTMPSMSLGILPRGLGCPKFHSVRPVERGVGEDGLAIGAEVFPEMIGVGMGEDDFGNALASVLRLSGFRQASRRWLEASAGACIHQDHIASRLESRGWPQTAPARLASWGRADLEVFRLGFGATTIAAPTTCHRSPR